MHMRGRWAEGCLQRKVPRIPRCPTFGNKAVKMFFFSGHFWWIVGASSSVAWKPFFGIVRSFRGAKKRRMGENPKVWSRVVFAFYELVIPKRTDCWRASNWFLCIFVLEIKERKEGNFDRKKVIGSQIYLPKSVFEVFIILETRELMYVTCN